GGDPDAELPQAPVQHTVLASASGTVTQLDALVVGQAAARLGAGRLTKDTPIDHAVGVVLHTSQGASIGAGEPLLTVYARREEDPVAAASQIEAATTIRSGAVGPREQSVIIERHG